MLYAVILMSILGVIACVSCTASTDQLADPTPMVVPLATPTTTAPGTTIVSKPTPTPESAPPTVTAVPPTATSTPAPTETPAPTPTEIAVTEPTPTQTRLGEAERDEFQRGYLPLVLVEVIVAMLEQTASQVLAGEIESDRVPFVLIEIAVLGEITDEMLRGQPPQPELEEAWTLGREALSLIQDIMTGWWHDEIAAEGIPQATEPVRALMRRAMQVADAGIASRYGIGEAELAAFRAKTVEEFRSTVGDVNAPE